MDNTKELEKRAQQLKDRIIWSKYPKLSEVFKNRPTENVLWLELAKLIRELQSS